MYTDLVTTKELAKLATRTLGNAVHDGIAAGSGDAYDAAVLAIQDATATVENALNRRLIIRPHELRFRVRDWGQLEGYEDGDEGLLWLACARQWPVVLVTAVDGDAALAAEVTPQDSMDEPGDGRYLSFDPDMPVLDQFPHRATVLAGYARADHVLADLQAVDGMSALAALPPVLPYDIRRWAERLALADLSDKVKGMVGVETVAKRADKLTVDYHRARTDLVKQMRGELYHHRHVGYVIQ